MPQLLLPGPPTPGWIVLIGGGEFSFGETAEIDRFLLGKMPADRRRVAFIPTASGSPDYAGHLGTYLRGLDASLEVINVPVYRARDLRRGRNLDAIRGAGLVYIGGGITRLLADTLRETPTEAAMREALQAGAVVAGIGAGAACLGAWAADQERPGGAVRGFGWLPETAVETAFDAEHSEPLRRLMSLPEIRLGIGIPRATALAIAPDRTGTIIGDGQVAVVRKG
ncbi:MAG TPA: Type 1 glutamine amidotransferase-like domain-containing protein [Thermoanaerobaculia bacterium]|nr:Type 1 glutamine amidotransferase-like domain-containing protein [Thermoanaerobaculia bacterium]